MMLVSFKITQNRSINDKSDVSEIWDRINTLAHKSQIAHVL